MSLSHEIKVRWLQEKGKSTTLNTCRPGESMQTDSSWHQANSTLSQLYLNSTRYLSGVLLKMAENLQNSNHHKNKFQQLFLFCPRNRVIQIWIKDSSARNFPVWYSDFSRRLEKNFHQWLPPSTLLFFIFYLYISRIHGNCKPTWTQSYASTLCWVIWACFIQ